MNGTEEKIIKVLDDLRPYLISDGGDVEFVKFENGIVYVKMIGACSQCEFIDFTIKDSIESVLINEISEVKEENVYIKSNFSFTSHTNKR